MEKIILDVDTGQDDAVALALASGFIDKFSIMGIIASYGNQVLDKVVINTLNMCQSLNLNVPVYRGSFKPLIRKQVIAGAIHGKTGLDGLIFEKLEKKCETKSGIDFLIETVNSNPGEVTLVFTGPLTDLALAMRLDPDFEKNVKRVVLMGGSSTQGNITPSSEFNIYADPESASVVFSSSLKIFVMSLDVTLKLILKPEILNIYRNFDNLKAKNFCRGMDFYTQSCKEYIHDYPAMHDPCCVAFLIEPEMFTFKKVDVKIETESKYCYGRTVVGFENNESNIFWATEVDEQRFWSLLEKAFRS
ncbi:MAG: nucleoside hydrolase [Sphaerochaetaceae bacterium]